VLNGSSGDNLVIQWPAAGGGSHPRPPLRRPPPVPQPRRPPRRRAVNSPKNDGPECLDAAW